jgi:hypothetical protein
MVSVVVTTATEQPLGSPRPGASTVTLTPAPATIVLSTTAAPAALSADIASVGIQDVPTVPVVPAVTAVTAVTASAATANSPRGAFAPVLAPASPTLPSPPRLIDIGANLLDGMFQGYYHGKQYHQPDLGEVLQRGWRGSQV